MTSSFLCNLESKPVRRPARFAKPMVPSGMRFEHAALLRLDPCPRGEVQVCKICHVGSNPTGSSWM